MKHDLPSVPSCSFWESNRLEAAGGLFVLMILAMWMIQIDSSGDEDGNLWWWCGSFHLQGIFEKKEEFKFPFCKISIEFLLVMQSHLPMSRWPRKPSRSLLRGKSSLPNQNVLQHCCKSGYKTFVNTFLLLTAFTVECFLPSCMSTYWSFDSVLFLWTSIVFLEPCLWLDSFAT